jgi:hypothetical protein
MELFNVIFVKDFEPRHVKKGEEFNSVRIEKFALGEGFQAYSNTGTNNKPWLIGGKITRIFDYIRLTDSEQEKYFSKAHAKHLPKNIELLYSDSAMTETEIEQTDEPQNEFVEIAETEEMIGLENDDLPI